MRRALTVFELAIGASLLIAFAIYAVNGLGIVMAS